MLNLDLDSTKDIIDHDDSSMYESVMIEMEFPITKNDMLKYNTIFEERKKNKNDTNNNDMDS